MKELQKESYESGTLGSFVSKQCEKVKERCRYFLSVFPSKKPKLFHSLINTVNSSNYNKFNHCGTSIEKIKRRKNSICVTLNQHKFRDAKRIRFFTGFVLLSSSFVYPSRFHLILNRAEVVEVDMKIPFFHTIYGCKKVSLNKRKNPESLNNRN